MAIISEHSWFDNQHPSAIDDYNDPSRSTTLSKAYDRLEVTLNKDLGNQYIETHQLAIPPVQCITADRLRLLSSVVGRHVNMSCDEYQTCVETVEDIICKAQVLLECVHDALSDVGIDDIGQLFGAPISLHRDETEAWVYKIQGSYVEEGADLSVNTADIKKRFMQVSEHSDNVWVYPAPHSHDSAASSAPTASNQATAAAPPPVGVQPSIEVVTDSGAGGRETSVEAQSGADVSEAPTPTREKAQGMHGTDSWTEDKFTAKPGRTQFPALSDRNCLLEEIDASSVEEEVHPETAESSDGGLPGTPESPCPPLFHAGTPGTVHQAPAAVAEGARPSKKMLQAIATRGGSCAGASPTQSASSPLSTQASQLSDLIHCTAARHTSCASSVPLPVAGTPPSTCMALDTADQRGDAPDGLICDVKSSANGSIATSITAPGEAVSERRLPANDSLARSLSELKLHASEAELCSGGAAGSCRALRQECKIHPERTGILVYPDDGTRASERHVMLQKLPPLLLCHFNRFQHSMIGTRKVMVHVSFPFQLYAHPDVASRPSLSSTDDACAVRYRLKAVLEHHGRQASSGHYTSYVWRPTAVVAAAAKHHAAEKGPDCPAAPCSKASKARARPRDIERSRSRGKGDQLSSSSLNDTSSMSEFQSARHGTGSFEHSMGSSLVDTTDNLFTSGSSWRQPGSVPSGRPHVLPELPHEEASSVEADLPVADWEELADTPAGLSCNTDPLAVHEADGVAGVSEESQSGGADCQTDEQEASQCGDEAVSDEPWLQDLMAEDEDGDGGVWLKCDDERVYEVPWQTVSNAQAYMLMYEQTMSGR